MSNQKRYSSSKVFGILWIILVVLIFEGIQYSPNVANQNIWLQIFLTANLASFFLYGIDKIQAITKKIRVPEIILYLSALLGGPIGALLAMHLFRHKTRKLTFQLILAVIVLIQIAVVLLIVS